jgi:hypothetical protein
VDEFIWKLIYRVFQKEWHLLAYFRQGSILGTQKNNVVIWDTLYV